jgi:phage gp29-like protein
MQLARRIDATCKRIARAVEKQLVHTLFLLNGWPLEAMPEVVAKTVNLQDVEQMVNALTSLANSGFHPDDMAPNEVRDIIGVSHAPKQDLNMPVKPAYPLPQALQGSIADEEDDEIPIEVEGA